MSMFSQWPLNSGHNHSESSSSQFQVPLVSILSLSISLPHGESENSFVCFSHFPESYYTSQGFLLGLSICILHPPLLPFYIRLSTRLCFPELCLGKQEWDPHTPTEAWITYPRGAEGGQRTHSCLNFLSYSPSSFSSVQKRLLISSWAVRKTSS